MAERLYVDTSVLAKRYLNESSSDEVDEYLTTHPYCAVTNLVLVEMRSLLARRRRLGALTRAAEANIFSTVARDVSNYFQVLVFGETTLATAIEVLSKVTNTSLRAQDSLHLAAAIDGECGTLATADRSMAAACKQLGVAVTLFA